VIVFLQALSPEDQTRWVVALAVAVVVVLVVTALLQAILVTARRIHRLVSDIWTGGTHIAGNTVNIAHLARTNHLASALLESAGSIAAAAERIGKATKK
jgi:hypothetical protein